MIQIINRAVVTLALISLGMILYNCGGDDTSITDCSRRGVPQHWDGSKWTCKK